MRSQGCSERQRACERVPPELSEVEEKKRNEEIDPDDFEEVLPYTSLGPL